MRIAIVGGGFCGLAVAWYLLESPLSRAEIFLFDSKGIGKGTSSIAAGLLHPFSGAHAKLNWRGFEGYKATQELLLVASKALNHPVQAAKKGILRLALTEKQRLDFQLCAQKFPNETEWLDEEACQRKIPCCAQAPGLWIKEGITIYSSLYIQGLSRACQEKGVKIIKKEIQSLETLDDYDIVIAATGAETLQLPECASLPLNRVKGQVLELSWPMNILPLRYPLNSHVYILMTEGGSSCLVGATYEKGFQKAQIDLEVAQKELLPKAIQLFPPLKEASILNCYCGMRAVAPQHHPLVKQLSPGRWLITGMGSKGLLYHALFAKELVSQLA